jgi:hypothetical protein
MGIVSRMTKAGMAVEIDLRHLNDQEADDQRRRRRGGRGDDDAPSLPAKRAFLDAPFPCPISASS